MSSSAALRFLLLPLLLAPTAANEPGFEVAEGALPSDDECGLGALDGSCAVNALQRRALQQKTEEGKPATMVETSVNVSSNSTWGYCAFYGCSGDYRPGQYCQCSPSCKKYRNCCYDYDSRCAAASNQGGGVQGGHGSVGGVMTLYHQTSQSACNSILKSGFRIGRGGWCGKGIYFATSPQATRTKAITPASGVGCMIEAKVNVGTVLRFPCCRYCGGRKDQHVDHNNGELKAKGYDSIQMNPGDGDEYIVYDPSKVLSMRTIPFQRSWMANPVKHW